MATLCENLEATRHATECKSQRQYYSNTEELLTTLHGAYELVGIVPVETHLSQPPNKALDTLHLLACVQAGCPD